MNEFLRELTHDNNIFQNQWNEINQRSQEILISPDGKTILNALAVGYFI